MVQLVNVEISLITCKVYFYRSVVLTAGKFEEKIWDFSSVVTFIIDFHMKFALLETLFFISAELCLFVDTFHILQV